MGGGAPAGGRRVAVRTAAPRDAGDERGGLSFLPVIVAAYLFFPRLKLSALKLVLGVAAALAVAVALVAGFGRL